MQVKKALITVAGTDQRKLPIQSLVDRDGKRRTVLEILIQEVRQAGIEEIGVVIHPGDKNVYNEITSGNSQIHLIEQDKPLGYGYAVSCGADFVDQDYFIHLVGDHLYMNRTSLRCANHLIQVAEKNNCSVSAVTSTRENLVPNYGTIGGKRIAGTDDLFMIERVIEKPTPTLAEQVLMIPGLRAGHYECFFGMHVFSPTLMQILKSNISNANGKKVWLSEALDELAGREQYLALDKHDLRIDIGSKYGLLKAQIALALSGSDREYVLAELIDLFATINLNNAEKKAND